MNAPLLPEVLALRTGMHQPSLPLATPGVQRYVWQHRYGEMLIEVVGDEVFVNGSRVQRHEAEPGAAAPRANTSA